MDVFVLLLLYALSSGTFFAKTFLLLSVRVVFVVVLPSGGPSSTDRQNYFTLTSSYEWEICIVN